MATIEFKGKVERLEYSDGTIAYSFIRCPILDRKHCDMHAFRVHKKYGPYANSDLFSGMLRRIRKDLFGDSGVIKIGVPYTGVRIDTSGFLAIVTIDV